MNRHKNYPLYPTVVFKDFRVLVDQSAEYYPDSPAISYKNDPNDEETVRVTYSEAAEDIRGLGTELISLGLRDRKCAIVGSSSKNWIYS